MESIFFNSIIPVLLASLITFHITRYKLRMKYETIMLEKIKNLEKVTGCIMSPEEITEYFNTLKKQIEIMLEASFVTNGYGKLFKENYLRIIQEKEIEKQLNNK